MAPSYYVDLLDIQGLSISINFAKYKSETCVNLGAFITLSPFWKESKESCTSANEALSIVCLPGECVSCINSGTTDSK